MGRNGLGSDGYAWLRWYCLGWLGHGYTTQLEVPEKAAGAAAASTESVKTKSR